MPRLSVLMPNYNHARYVTQAIETLVTQSRPPDEFLVIDDCSTDNSVEVIEGLARRYPLIRFLRNEQNLGVTRTFDRLLGMATGDYLYLPAADDYNLPGFFEKAMAMAAEHPQAALIFGQFRAIDETGKELFHVKPSHWDRPLYASPERYLREIIDEEAPSIAFSGSTIYRRAPLEEVGYFRPELGSWSDTFANRAVALKYGACYIPEMFMVWRVLRGSFSQTTARDVRKTLDIIGRSAWLMRSPEFRDRFPETSVASWETRYRNEVIGQQLSEQDQLFDAASDRLARVLTPGTFGQRLVRRVLVRALRLCRAAGRAASRRALYSYRPDLSCYAPGK